MTADEARGKDPVAWAAAEAITELTKVGEDIVLNARRKATGDMAKMVDNLRSKEAKIEALKYHGMYLGAAAQFSKNVMPQYKQMQHDLTELTGDEKYVDILMDFWLAKVIRDVTRDLQNEVR